MSKATKRIRTVCDKLMANGLRLTKAQQDTADLVCSWCHMSLAAAAPIERGIIEASTKSDKDELYRIHDACWQIVKRLKKRNLIRRRKKT